MKGVAGSEQTVHMEREGGGGREGGREGGIYDVIYALVYRDTFCLCQKLVLAINSAACHGPLQDNHVIVVAEQKLTSFIDRPLCGAAVGWLVR